MNSIPPEILIEIIHHATTRRPAAGINGDYDTPFAAIDFPTTLACCLVSGAWNDIATAILHSNECCTIASQQDVEQLLSTPPEERKTTHLTVNSVRYDEKLAQALPSLTHLALRFCKERELGPRRFDLIDAIANGARLGESLVQPGLANLRCLRFAHTSAWIESFDPLTSDPAFRLSELQVPWFESPSLWRNLFDFSATTLTSLTLYARRTFRSLDPSAPPFGPQLVHLAIYGRDLCQVDSQLQEAFRACTRLRSAGIASIDLVPDLPEAIEDLVINDARVHNLESLRNVHCGNGFEERRRDRKRCIPVMAKSISDAFIHDRLPRLRRLTCCGYLSEREQQDSDDYEVQFLGYMLDKRGIKLWNDATSFYW